MERPSIESFKRSAREVLHTLGRVVTCQAFLPERPLASHGDHFEAPLDVPAQLVIDWPEPRTVPDIEGRDV